MLANLNLELGTGFTHKIKKKKFFFNDWEEELFFYHCDRRVCMSYLRGDCCDGQAAQCGATFHYLAVTIASRLTTHLAVPYGQKRPVSQAPLCATQYPWSSSRVQKGWRPPPKMDTPFFPRETILPFTFRNGNQSCSNILWE